MKPDSGFKIFTKKLAIAPDPEQVFEHLYGNQPYAFWLDSSRVEAGLSRFSFMGDDQGTHSLRVEYADQTLIVTQNQSVTRIQGHIFDYLQEQLDARFCQAPDLPWDFNCGFVGYLGYELKSECGAQVCHSSPLPDAVMILATQIIVFDHQEQVTYLVYLGKSHELEPEKTWLTSMADRLLSLPPLPPLPSVVTKAAIKFEFRRDHSDVDRVVLAGRHTLELRQFDFGIVPEKYWQTAG